MSRYVPSDIVSLPSESPRSNAERAARMKKIAGGLQPIAPTDGRRHVDPRVSSARRRKALREEIERGMRK